MSAITHEQRDALRIKIGLAREALKDADRMALGAAGRHYKSVADALDWATGYCEEAAKMERKREIAE